jgi:hypothetical protein
MSDKKHIDRIFQEKFKDFEATPSPEVWKGIQDKLNQPEKDRKRIIPFWFKLAGVAALLLLFLTVGNILVKNSTSGNTINTKVVDTENTSGETTNPSGDSTNPSNESIDNSTVADTSNEENNQENLEDSNLESQKVTNNLNASKSSQIASEEEGTQTKSINNNNNNNSTKVSKNNPNKNKVVNPSSSTNKTDTRITENTTSKNKVNTGENATEINSKNPIRNKNNIAETNITIKDNKNISDETFDKNNTGKQLQELNNLATENAVAETENIETDIEKTVEEELNKTNLTIEEAIAANEDLIEEEKDEIINRWQVYANIAPVYYNSMGKGSQIDEQFVDNSKTGEVNTSYGVNVSYNLNKKLSIRTGLSSLNLSYDTNDVILYESIASSNSAPSTLRNINLAKGLENLTALSKGNLSVAQIDNSLSPKSSAAISQRISYFEIPMELNYRIGNNKVGLNLIAGFSSFILNGNEVYSELNDEKTYIGEANNINNMSFSTNFGIGLDYKFSEKVKFNLEPTFKYQLNAFENTSGNFNPYIIGVYTGLSYKF